jgi:hypothetical protein
VKTIATSVGIKGTSFWNNKNCYRVILKPRKETGWEFTLTNNNRKVRIPVIIESLTRPLTPVGKRQLVLMPRGNPLGKDRIKVAEHLVEYPNPVGIQSLTWFGDSESFKQFSEGRPFTWRTTHLFTRSLARKINFPLAIFSDQYSLTAENYQEKKRLIDSQGNSIDIAAHRLIDFLEMLSFIPGRLFGTIKNVRSSHLFDRLFVEKLLNSGLKRLN